jgi:hypothetical protein
MMYTGANGEYKGEVLVMFNNMHLPQTAQELHARLRRFGFLDEPSMGNLAERTVKCSPTGIFKMHSEYAVSPGEEPMLDLDYLVRMYDDMKTAKDNGTPITKIYYPHFVSRSEKMTVRDVLSNMTKYAMEMGTDKSLEYTMKQTVHDKNGTFLIRLNHEEHLRNVAYDSIMKIGLNFLRMALYAGYVKVGVATKLEESIHKTWSTTAKDEAALAIDTHMQKLKELVEKEDAYFNNAIKDVFFERDKTELYNVITKNTDTKEMFLNPYGALAEALDKTMHMYRGHRVGTVTQGCEKDGAYTFELTEQ